MQISIDGVRRNETTEKVLDNLKKRLLALRDHARFRVTVSGVIGAAPPNEAEEVVAFARELGFTPRVLLVHDEKGQLKLKPEEVKAFQRIVDTLPKNWMDFSSYRKRLVRDGSAPFKCRAGSRYLYIDEFGNVNWCSQTRTVWSKPLADYTRRRSARTVSRLQIVQQNLHSRLRAFRQPARQLACLAQKGRRQTVVALSDRQFWWAVLGIVLLTIVTRLPALQHPQAIDDEETYSVVANVIVDGGRPYVDAVERKPPLLFWTYAAVVEAAGKYNWKALHVVALAWTLATMAGLYVIGRGLFDRATGLIAALLYSVFQPWGELRDLAFNGELMMNLPVVWAWAIGLRRNSSRLRPELFFAGFLLGAGFLLKQPAAIAAVPLGIYLLLPAYRSSRALTRWQSVLQAALLTAGFATALGLVAARAPREGHPARGILLDNHRPLDSTCLLDQGHPA